MTLTVPYLRDHAHYRPEIDGLRAVAVLPVILYHAKVPWLAGGYVGVDIFFVISGYLITAIILRDIGDGKFSLLQFYERRARRLLPMLFVVIATVIPFAWILMTPDQLKSFGQSVVATILFSNNILLAITSGYWDLSVDQKPMLHTWSLGIEEQFYFAFPIFAYNIARLNPRRQAAIIFAVAATSLASAALMHHIDSAINYFSPLSRAWELLAGALCAVAIRGGISRPGDLASSVGLALILISFVVLDGRRPFSPLCAVPAVTGTCFLILAGGKCASLRVLATWPLVSLGVLSYGAYLWHQPIISLIRVASFSEPPMRILAAAGLSSFILALFTFVSIEAPWRRASTVPRVPLFATLSVAAIVLLVCGLAAHLTGGFPSRFANGGAVSHPAGSLAAYNENVFLLRTDSFADSGRRKTLVVGNSYARDFVNMLREVKALNQLDLVYREDVLPCRIDEYEGARRDLLNSAEVLIFASGEHGECFARVEEKYRSKDVYFVGTKQFGYALGPVLRRDDRQRITMRADVLPSYRDGNIELSTAIPKSQFVDLFIHLSHDGGYTTRVVDGCGNLLSGDLSHLTPEGARFLGRGVFADSELQKSLGISPMLGEPICQLPPR